MSRKQNFAIWDGVIQRQELWSLLFKTMKTWDFLISVKRCISGMLVFLHSETVGELQYVISILKLRFRLLSEVSPSVPSIVVPEKKKLCVAYGDCVHWMQYFNGYCYGARNFLNKIYTFRLKLMAICALNIWFSQSADKTLLPLKETGVFLQTSAEAQ